MAAAAVAKGVLRGDRVAVADPAHAKRLQKALVGTPGSGDGLTLDLAEAAVAVGEGRLAVERDGKPCGLAELLALGADGGHRAEVDYLVARDLRDRGLAVRRARGVGHFDVWPRGKSDGPPAFQVKAVAEGDPFTGDDLAQGAPNGLVVAVVDGDGTVTHYRLAVDEPAGDVPDGEPPKAEGRVLADRVLVEDPAAAAAYRTEFLGRPHGDGAFLSFAEAESLRRRGALDLPARFAQHAAAADAHFAALLPVFLDLRARAVVPKSGLRFGAHLRGYRGDPDEGHAEWLVHCASGPLSWSDVARGVRLAHGVRKRFLVAVPQGGRIVYVHVSWMRV